MDAKHDDNLINALGIASLPDEQKARILDSAARLVEQRLMLRLYKSLDEAKRDELSAVLEANDKDKLDAFIAGAAPDFLDWIQEEIAAIKDELKGLGEIE